MSSVSGQVNESAIVPFVSGQLNNLELALSLAKRGNLPGAENVVVQRFQELFAQTKYKEAVELAAESPQGILLTPDIIAKFSVPVQAGQTPPLLQYFGTLMFNGKLNAFETLELSRLVVNQNKKNLLENWLAEDKLECSEELGDLVKTLDIDLALNIYMKARATPKVVAAFAEHGGEPIIPFSCALERNLTDLPEDEAAKYCEENKIQSALSKIIKTGFSAINLIYFFTAGPDEVKCWQIQKQSKAPQAAGAIHTDFERGFICAEVMKFEDLKEHGSESAVKAAGKYKQEGKTYVVQDGDIIFFKFNVSGGGKK